MNENAVTRKDREPPPASGILTLLKGREVLTPPNSPSDGVRVAMIVHNGAPVELIEFLKT